MYQGYLIIVGRVQAHYISEQFPELRLTIITPMYRRTTAPDSMLRYDLSGRLSVDRFAMLIQILVTISAAFESIAFNIVK